MALPFFYIPTYDPASPELTLDEDNSRHIVQVLRMTPGEALRLTDGKGALLTAVIIDGHKKKCRVEVRSVDTQPAPSMPVTIAISPLKNASRFEWFLEKATEIGVSSIVPLLCERTERQITRQDRLQHILISAMLQSQQTWLPILPEPVDFPRLIAQPAADPMPVAAGAIGLRLIAHCLEAPRPTATLADVVRNPADHASGSASPLTPAVAKSAPAGVNAVDATTVILIGPEGDFSPKEVETALAAGFLPVSLGRNRLRTETAGVVAATLLCIR